MTQSEKQSLNNYRAMLKRNHFCRECLRQDAFTLSGRTYCADCSEKRKKQRRDGASPESKLQDSVRHKELRDQRRGEHKCVGCGKQLESQDKHVYCSVCRAKRKKNSDTYRAKFNKNYPRGENGICFQCNKAVAMEGRRLCSDCYDKAVKSAAHARQFLCDPRRSLKRLFIKKRRR